MHDVELSPEQVASNAHISDEEIERDIADTEHEIAVLRSEEIGLRLAGDRMSVYRADARKHGIRDREEFVAKLRALLAARKAQVDGTDKTVAMGKVE